MQAILAIPNGWIRVRRGKVRVGRDRALQGYGTYSDSWPIIIGTWEPITGGDVDDFSGFDVRSYTCIIRRRKKKKP